MPVCLPDDTDVYCIPPAYSEVLRPGAPIRVTGIPENPSAAAVKRAGARVFLGSDEINSARRAKALRTHDGVVFYTKVCSQLSCHYEVRFQPQGSTASLDKTDLVSLSIEGVDPAGLERAQRSISIRVGSPDRPEFLALADLPDAP